MRKKAFIREFQSCFLKSLQSNLFPQQLVSEVHTEDTHFPNKLFKSCAFSFSMATLPHGQRKNSNPKCSHKLRFVRQLETWVSLLVLRLQLMEEAPQTQVLQYEELQLMKTTILALNSFALGITLTSLGIKWNLRVFKAAVLER